jgi:pyruvate dehydrogenase E2 component (dihydrolipoamide acetyltransferase)
MAEEVLMLALSPTMETGTIAKWHKKEGDPIQTGDILCEVETDKATMEYESQNDGTLLRILVSEGGEAGVGQPIAIAGEEGEDISKLGVKAEQKAKEEVEAKGEEKAEAEAEAVEKERPPAEAVVTAAGGEEHLPGGVKASPLARKLAETQGVDLTGVAGSGPGGRIVKHDLERDLTRDVEETGEKPKAARPKADLISEEIPLTQMRKTIIKRLSESMYSAPHYYLTAIATVDGLIRARAELNRKRDSKISFNAFLIRFAAQALKRHPKVNSSFRGDSIVQFGRADIGLAVAQPDGLITPVVRDAWNRGIVDIDGRLRDLVKKAKTGRLKPEEYSDATFTITNLGSFGIHDFTAIINPPGSAILAVGEIRREAFEDEGDAISFRSVMHLTLSCDHRVIDGAVGALFLRDLADIMEAPIKMLY